MAGGEVPFVKMHGCGNDYVYLNGFNGAVEMMIASKMDRRGEWRQLVVEWCDRHRGIGADGVIVLLQCDEADFRMAMFNADGSRGKMCGNGIRCAAKLFVEKVMAWTSSKVPRSITVSVMTDAGMRRASLTRSAVHTSEIRAMIKAPITSSAEWRIVSGGMHKVRNDVRERIDAKYVSVLESVSVEMGRAQPLAGTPFHTTIEVTGRTCHCTMVDVGNEHCVVLLKDADGPVALYPVDTIGPLLEKHDSFPCSVNVEFAQVLDNGTVRVRTWERGSQETQACGTGACATVYALCAQGITPPRNAIDDGKDLRMHMVNVELLGGSLTIACDPEHGNVMMTGPAVKVFDGVITVR